MKKLLFLSACFIFGLFRADAQEGLNIKNGEKGLYLLHNVAAKEGLYSIGRLYNVNPKHIAAFNKIDLNKGLNIDQVIQIPLTDTNFNQKSKKGVPVYYTVEENQGLQKISSLNKKVSVQNLKSWNNLTGDNVKSGSRLVVGFLISKEFSASALNHPPAQTTKPAEEKTVIVSSPNVEKTSVTKATAKEKPVVEEKVQPKTIEKETKSVVVQKDNDDGFFKPFFDQQVKSSPATRNTTVTASIFKTVSGWQDAKYYLLIDGVPAGNIVKVINPETNKAIYAKVLGEMNGIRQNQGLGTRISTAAASALGITETEKFEVKLNY